MRGVILCRDDCSPRIIFFRPANYPAERCWSGRTGLTANQFHLKRVTGVRIPASPPFQKFLFQRNDFAIFPFRISIPFMGLTVGEISDLSELENAKN